MDKRGFEIDYLVWIILGLITMGIIFGAIAIFGDVGEGGLGEILRTLLGINRG